MSFSLVRTAVRSAGKLFSSGRSICSVQALPRSVMMKGTGVETLRSFTRSHWYMCHNTRAALHQRDSQTGAGWTRSCGCCGLHTQGDKDLVQFLEQEISEEKKMSKKLGSVKGFEVSADGSEVVFKRKSDNECVTVTLNVNNSVDDDSGVDMEQDANQAQDAKMVSRPPFLVEINKGGQFTLGLQCAFPPAEDYSAPHGEEEQYGTDMIEIQEVALYSGDNWGDKTYSVEGPVMDGNLYDMLLNMLEERGIDADFVDQMVEHCTVYEHQRYVAFLQGLKDFAGSK